MKIISKFKQDYSKWLLVLIASVSTIGFLLESHKLSKIRSQNRAYKKWFSKIPSSLPPSNPSARWPIQLQNIPFSDDLGIVLNSKTIAIRGVTAPYNASIIENEKSGSGYLLFFRYDEIDNDSSTLFHSHIACAELDSNFEQTEKEFQHVTSIAEHAEDPRVLKVGSDLLLVYNALHCDPTHYRRTMRIAKIDPETFKASYDTNLDLQEQPVEKNWVPFVYAKKGKEPSVHFEYTISPRRILDLPDPKTNSLVSLKFPQNSPFKRLFWPDDWGSLKGGTPAIKVDGEYLAFFHSSFNDNGYRWYMMGAYTFAGEPPFSITSISQYPILFKGIYSSTPLNLINLKLRCIFPCGFVVSNKDGRELIHIACGENDSAVRIVTLDKISLLKGLKKLKTKRV
ncbi:MAG: hypothetical protein JSR76_07695 [Verrucomicrobia bacterium]|nr:hypothetical protein [Verrucomicrobiota bacterium]